MKKIRQWFAGLKTIQKVVLGFAVVILTGAILLTLPIAAQSGRSVGFGNALFTSTSAVCVTGLVVVDTGTTYTLFGQIVILLLIQTGGLGWMTLATLLFMAVKKRIHLRDRMIIAESLGSDSLAGLVKLVIMAAKVAFTVEIIGALLLMTQFIPQFGFAKGLYMSIFHSVSAFCNAGFDIIGNFRSMTPYLTNPVISLTICLLIIVGGMGFAVVHELVTRKKGQRLSLHARIVVIMTSVLVIGGMIAFTLMEWNNPATMAGLSAPNKIMAGFFQSVTTRTAGFNTIGQASMQSGSKFLSMILMFIGASPASTGGGIKTTTFFCLLFITASIVSGCGETSVFKRRLPRELVRKVGAIITLALGLVITATFIIAALQPQIPVDAVMYDAVSAFGTVGLSYGITPHLATIPKMVIALLMFVGRVGPLSLTMALAHERDDCVRYPEGHIIV
jgi:trk system potassium uptake protein TrkH